jgi:hypothetical protein
MALAAVACDKFFSLAGVVTRCDDKSPLADVAVKGVLDEGVGEEDVMLLSDQEGKFQVFMNEPSDAWVTVTLSKPGFKPVSHQFRGSDGYTAQSCLATSDSTESSTFE